MIESAVVKEITSYDEAFKPVREELKQLISLKDKQLMRRKHLDRIKERGYRNRQETVSFICIKLLDARLQQKPEVAIT